MPVKDRYPLADVLAACRRFYEAKRRMVFVEYVMLGGVNDRYEQAVQLARVLDPNVQGQPHPLQPDRDVRRLEPRGDRRVPGRARGARIGATVRLTRGRDIDAACGQLAAKA